MKTSKITLLFLISLLFTFSCTKDSTVSPVDVGYNYYPAEVGKWWIYDVDSIVHDGLNLTVDTHHYQIKEILESSFINYEGKTSYRLERTKRLPPTDNWSTPRIWTISVTETRMEKTEEDLRYIRLIFPTRTGSTWDGNAFNTTEKMEHEYTEVDIPASIGNIAFDSTLTVVQQDNTNLIEKRYKVEKYARKVGLYYKDYTDLDLQTKAGLEYRMSLVSYGN